MKRKKTKKNQKRRKKNKKRSKKKECFLKIESNDSNGRRRPAYRRKTRNQCEQLEANERLVSFHRGARSTKTLPFVTLRNYRHEGGEPFRARRTSEDYGTTRVPPREGSVTSCKSPNDPPNHYRGVLSAFLFYFFFFFFTARKIIIGTAHRGGCLSFDRGRKTAEVHTRRLLKEETKK